MEKEWEFTIGLYLGILIGFRHYDQENCIDYVLYFPFIDFCITVYKE